MSGGKGADKRIQWRSVRAWRMREAGMTLGEIARALEIDRASVADRIKIGQRLATLPEFSGNPTRAEPCGS